MSTAPGIRLALFTGVGLPFEFREIPPPTPGPGEALVEISLATICGSDLHTVDGRRTGSVPCVLGHEAVGRVVAVGPGRDPELLGRRVTWSLADSCGHCRPCLDWDLPQKCGQLFKYGHAPVGNGTGLNGCYASHILLRGGTAILPVPDVLADAVVAPANCALATMVAATEPLSRGGDCALVQGAGLLGIYGCALLKSMGWRRVLVTDRRPGRLVQVAAFGGEPVPGEAMPGVAAGSVDAVLEVTGDPAVVPEGLRVLRPGGHYGFVGMVHPGSALDLTGERIVRQCLTLRGTHNYAPRHLATALRFLVDSAASRPWASLVSAPVPLESLGAAFDDARAGIHPRVGVDPRGRPETVSGL